MSETTTTENAVMPSVKINPIELSFQTNEAVKMLRANLQFSGYGLRAIALTSCNPNEGKSWVSFELARSLAELGKRTLFLDCDIRNSVLQSRLGINEKLPGLTDFLVGKASVGEILCKTNLSHLHMVFAGSVSPNPAELLSDQMFERLCEWETLMPKVTPLSSIFTDLSSNSGRETGVTLLFLSKNCV